jgi:hypothetical protein
VKFAGQAFRREKAPLVFGAALAAFGGGLSRDVPASYLPAFYLAGVACLLAALLVLGARPARKAQPSA